MFSFFKKPKHNRLNDRIYITRQVADAALVNELEQLRQSKKTVWVIYYFQETANRLSTVLNTENSADANQLIKNIAVRNKVKAKPDVHFLFSEHYPHWQTEQTLINELELLCEKPTLAFYFSLDEPLMQKFGADKVADMMKKMGMKDDEVITNNMVDMAIKRSQEKIAKKVTTEIAAKSASEWLKINLPQSV